MGFFSSINEAMNEEFIIGEHNIERVRENPNVLEEVLQSQRERGFGPTQKLRQHAREMNNQTERKQAGMPFSKSRYGVLPNKAPHWLWKATSTLTKFTGIAILAILAGALWASNENKKKGGNGNIF